MYDTIGFIGAGRITRIMLEGLRRAGALPRRILVHDPDAAAVAALQRVPGVEGASLAQAGAAARPAHRAMSATASLTPHGPRGMNLDSSNAR